MKYRISEESIERPSAMRPGRKSSGLSCRNSKHTRPLSYCQLVADASLLTVTNAEAAHASQSGELRRPQVCETRLVGPVKQSHPVLHLSESSMSKPFADFFLLGHDHSLVGAKIPDGEAVVEWLEARRGEPPADDRRRAVERVYRL